MSETETQKPVAVKPNSGNAVAAVILGAVGFLFWVGLPWVGLGMASLALALGIYSRKKQEGQKASAIVGIVLGSIGIFVSAISLLVGAVINSALSNAERPDIEYAKKSEPLSEPAEVAAIGSQVVDGTFTFTVNDMQCGITTVGNEYLNATAQGQYCRFSLTVTNTGREPQYMFAANQKAFDSSGREFAQDSTPSVYDDSGNVWMTEINPGNSVTGNIYFDVPADVTLNRLELHDSAFSRGVSVQLN